MAYFEVLFCTTRMEALEAAITDSVVVWPVKTGWNDFGFGFHAKAIVTKSLIDQQSLEIELLIIPGPNEPEAQRFDSWIKKLRSSGEILRAGELERRFFSILRSEKTYKDLVQWAAALQVQVADVLFPLRDIVYFRAHQIEADKISIFLMSTAAQNGVFRSEQTYFAWHRGARILAKGDLPVDVEDARSEIVFETTLPGFSGPHSIRLSYGVPEPLNDRCHALIGRNGVGKSQLLREFIIALGRRLDENNIDPFTSRAHPRGSGTTLFPDNFRVNRVLALSWDSHSDFPLGARLDSRLEYLYFDMRNDDRDFYKPADIMASDTPASQLIQLLREHLGGMGQGFIKLRATLRPLFDSEDLAVAVRRTEDGAMTNWLSLRELKGASEGRQLELFGNLELGLLPRRLAEDGTPVELSSGERTFLIFAIRCAARVETGTFLLLDEPETHLHPTLVSDFMRVLSALLDTTKSTALVATHSPFIVRELPARCVHVLRVDEDRTPSISSAFLRTFGASVDVLAADIFEDAETAKVSSDVAKLISESGLSGEEIRERYGRELSLDLLSEIRQIMRDAKK